MSPRATRWLLFGALVLALPLPTIGPFDGFVPTVRYAILLGAAGAVALAEGAAGPVPGILALLGANLALGLALVWALAWGLARLSRALPDGLRGGLALAAVAALLGVASLFEIYETGFGRAPRANLFGLFG